MRKLLTKFAVMLTVMVLAAALTGCGNKNTGDQTSPGDGICTVSFNTGTGGSAVADKTVAKGGKVEKPADPTTTVKPALTAGFYSEITGSVKTFEAWHKDSPSGAVWNFDTDTVSADITLYAAWTGGSAGTQIILTDNPAETIIDEAIAYINSDQDGADDSGATEYTLVLGADIVKQTAVTLNKAVTLTITTLDTTERTITKRATVGAADDTEAAAKSPAMRVPYLVARAACMYSALLP